MLDKAESAEFIELQPTPVLKYSVKTSILIWVVAQIRISVSFPTKLYNL